MTLNFFQIIIYPEVVTSELFFSFFSDHSCMQTTKNHIFEALTNRRTKYSILSQLSWTRI